MKYDFFVGIDFGHGETCASKYNIKNNKVTQIELIKSSGAKKVISAIYKNKEQWSLVIDEDDFKAPYVRAEFKDFIVCPTDTEEDRTKREEKKEDFIKFAKLIFEKILEDRSLKYNKITGDKNFQLGIACPSDWGIKVKEDYLSFFRNDCGIPVDTCIKESDAAFFSKYDDNEYDLSKTTLVIDIGSSSIDYTLYSNYDCIDSWGNTKGASKIEDVLYDVIFEESEGEENKNRRGIIKAQEFKSGDIRPTIRLFIRRAKEKFFTDRSKPFEILKAYHEVCDKYDVLDYCINYRASRPEFFSYIDNYIQSVLSDVEIIKRILESKNLKLDYILLSGGASRMNFIEDYLSMSNKETEESIHFAGKYIQDNNTYNNEIIEKDYLVIKRDTEPEWVVSNGIVTYAKHAYDALQVFKDNLSALEYASLYKKADEEATKTTLLAKFPDVILGIKKIKHPTGRLIINQLCNYLRTLHANIDYKEKLKSVTNTKLASNIELELIKAIKQKFNTDVKDITINLNIEPISIGFSEEQFIGSDKLSNYTDTWYWEGKFLQWVRFASDNIVNFNLDQELETREVERIIERITSEFKQLIKEQKYYYEDELISETVDLIKINLDKVLDKVFYSNGLFNVIISQQ